jgi:hypothetical protein
VVLNCLACLAQAYISAIEWSVPGNLALHAFWGNEPCFSMIGFPSAWISKLDCRPARHRSPLTSLHAYIGEGDTCSMAFGGAACDAAIQPDLAMCASTNGGAALGRFACTAHNQSSLRKENPESPVRQINHQGTERAARYIAGATSRQNVETYLSSAKSTSWKQ